MSIRDAISLVALLGLSSVIPGLPAEAADPESGHHLLSGPVKVVWEAQCAWDCASAPAIATSADGAQLFLVGSVEEGLRASDYATAAFEIASGDPLWNSCYDGPASDRDYVDSLAVCPYGTRVYVTGTVDAGHGTGDYATLAYDITTGDQVWSTHYDGPASSLDQAYSLALSPDGATVLVTGSSRGVATGSDYATLAYDAATGVQLWSTRFDWMPWYDDVPRSLAVSPDNSTVFVTGDSSWFFRDSNTVAYDRASGEQVWLARDDMPGWGDNANAIAVSPDSSRVFVTGHSSLRWKGPHDYVTLAYDSTTGGQLWTARYDGPASGQDEAHSLAIHPDGSTVYVTGSSPGIGTSRDYATLAYDSITRQTLWIARYDGPESDRDDGQSLAVSPDGSTVYVTGSSTGSGTGSDFTTIAYDAGTGDEIWSARYDGSASMSDIARSLTVSPDGSIVFVSGSVSTAGSTHYAILAYAYVQTVNIDVVPQDPHNTLAACARGAVPVAILGSANFDVSEVDTSTLRFGPDEAECQHDLTDPFSYKHHVRDVNGDGYLDLMTHYSMQATGIIAGQDSAALSGRMYNGRFIGGTDSIVVRRCR